MAERTEIYDRLNHQPKILGVPFVLLLADVVFFFVLTPILSLSSLRYYGLLIAFGLSLGVFFFSRFLARFDFFDFYGRLNRIIDSRISPVFYTKQTITFR